MTSNLKILHLEDNKNDAELVKETLFLNNIESEIIHVDNKKDFITELEKKDWSIVLADYNLPGFDGLEALAIAKKSIPDIPFIFISGVLGEELAIETLKQGATDYVIKSRLERLAPAVKRALKETEEKAQRIKLEREIVELEQSIGELQTIYQQLTRRVRGFLKIELPSGKYTIVDKFLEDLSGYEIAKWQETPFFIREMIHTDDKKEYEENIEQMLQGFVPKLLEYRIIQKDGEERWWLQFNIGAFDADGRLTSISAVIIDNTDNKSAVIKYQNLFENALMGMYRSNIETGEIIEANEKMAEIFGYTSVDEFKEHNANEFYLRPQSRKELIDRLSKNGSYEELIMPFKRKNGSFLWVSESARIYPDEGYLEGMLIDITDRKRAEDAIKRDRRAFQSIAEATIYSKDLPSFCQKILNDLTETLDFEAGTVRLFDPITNTLIPIAVFGIPEEEKAKLLPVSLDDDTHVGARVAKTREAIFAPDVLKDETLKDKSSRLKSLLVRANITYPILDAENNLLGVLQLVDQKPKEIFEEDRILFETITDLFTSAIIQFKSRDALEESEEKFRTFAEQSLIGVMIISISNEVQFINDEFLNITEFPLSEIYQRPINDWTSLIMSNEDRMALQTRLEQTAKDLQPISGEYLISSKSGKQKWISLYVAPITKDSKIENWGVTVLDITEEKKVRKIIERERQAFNLIAEATINAKDIPDLCKRILNGLAESLQFEIGTCRLYDNKSRMLDPIAIYFKDQNRISEIRPMSIDDTTYINSYVARFKTPVFAPDVTKNPITREYINRVQNFDAQALVTYPILDAENELLGTLQIAATNPKELEDEDRIFFETIIRLFATALERKWAEAALRDSEEKYRVLVETLPLAIFVFDLEGRILVANELCAKIYGVENITEIIGKKLTDFIADEEKEFNKELRKNLYSTGLLSNIELLLKRRDGSHYVGELNVRLLKNEKGEPTSSIGVLQDITNRKDSEKAQQRLVNIISNSNEVVISADPNGIITYANPTIERVFGYTPDEIIGKPTSILSPPKLKEQQQEMHKQVMKQDKLTFETVRQHKDGSLVPVIVNITSLKDDNEKLISINGLILDISDLKKLEESLRDKYKEFELFNKIISAGYRANNLNEFLDFTLNTILTSLDFTGGGIFIINELEQFAEIKRAEGIPKDLLQNIKKVKIDSPQFKRLFMKGETIVLQEFKDIDQSHGSLGVNTLISVPFFSKQKVIGALTLVSKIKREISNENKQMLESLGRDIGTAIAKFIAEEELSMDQSTLLSIFDSIDDFIFAVDVETGAILDTNKAAREHFQSISEASPLKTLKELHLPHHSEMYTKQLEDLRKGKLEKFQMPVTTKEGTKVDTNVTTHLTKYKGRDVLITIVKNATE